MLKLSDCAEGWEERSYYCCQGLWIAAKRVEGCCQKQVPKFLSGCMGVMLGADPDDQSQTSDQLWVAGKDVID